MFHASTRLLGAGLGIIILLAAGGCPFDPFNWLLDQLTDWPKPTVTAGGKQLRAFASDEEMLNFFRAEAAELAQQRGGMMDGLGGDIAFDMAVPTAAAAPSEEAGGASDEADTSYTTTNIQEAGVDESDVFKSDGENFYIAKNTSLRIVRAVPADEMAELGRVDFEETIDSLYLLDSTVLVLTRQYSYDYGPYGGAEIMMWPPYYANATVVVYALDVANPAAPVVTAKNEFDGALVSSRLTGGRLILVLNYLPALTAYDSVPTQADMALGDVLPMMRTGDAEQAAVASTSCYYPETLNGHSMTAVITLSATDITSVLGSVAVLTNAETIYASTEAVYVASQDWGMDTDFQQRTLIHKFTIDDAGVPAYAGSGAVPGYLLNQFSLGEYEGHLRVATHLDAWGRSFMMSVAAPPMMASAGQAQDSDQSVSSTPTQVEIETNVQTNAVWVLAENAGQLDVVGKVTGIAPNESLYSARFMGTRGFLVTYRKVDPLFVLDLNDPTNPQIVGELKIPGFSDYLHPWGDTHLIGVGKATYATDEGFDWYQGVQISLFNVTDWSNPQVVQQLTFGGRGSECDVSSTHKAFAFLPDEGLLALPMVLMTQNDVPWDYGEFDWAGVIAFQVEQAAGFTELGRLDAVGDSEWGWGWSAWRRPAFIGDTLYAVTPAGVSAAPTTDFSAASTLELTPDTTGSEETGTTE